jgi:hypothetical protein
MSISFIDLNHKTWHAQLHLSQGAAQGEQVTPKDTEALLISMLLCPD